MNGAPDMPNLVRSRMIGTLGLAVNFRSVSERDLNELTQEFQLARVIRDYQAGSASYLLTAQAGSHPAWDVVEQWSTANQRGVLWAFDNDGGRSTVRLAGLNPADMYELRDMDTNRRQRISGSTLLDTGFDLLPRDGGAAQIYTIQSVGGTAAARRLK